MKFVVHTPLDSRSAIGSAARLVVIELIAQGHEVTLIASDLLRATEPFVGVPGAAVRHWSDASVDLIHEAADGVFYHIGNHYDFHAGCLEWMPKRPGIVVLHDYYLGHLFLGWASDGHGAQADRVCARFSGLSFDEFSARSRVANFIERTRSVAPMTEWVAAMATGVIVHSAWDIDRVLAWCPGPVRVTPLAYAPRAAPAGTTSRSISTLRVLTFGHINRNKLAHAVLEAIRLNPNLVRRIEYRLVGPIEDDYARELELAASDAGVLLQMLGRVSDEDLAAELEQSDVVCCLRMPALESASASAIESLASGRPTVVVDTGFYSELPDHVVMKIDPWDIVGGLGDVLSELSESAGLRSDLGLRGKVYAEKTFGAGDYAVAMEEIASETLASAHVVATVSRASRTLFDWAGQGPEEAIRQLIDPLTIFDPEPRRGQPARVPLS